MQSIQQLQYIRIVNGCQQFRFTFCSGAGKIIEKSEFYRQISARLEELDHTELYSIMVPGNEAKASKFIVNVVY